MDHTVTPAPDPSAEIDATEVMSALADQVRALTIDLAMTRARRAGTSEVDATAVISALADQVRALSIDLAIARAQAPTAPLEDQ